MENYLRKHSFSISYDLDGFGRSGGAGGVDIAPTPDAPGSSARPCSNSSKNLLFNQMP